MIITAEGSFKALALIGRDATEENAVKIETGEALSTKEGVSSTVIRTKAVVVMDDGKLRQSATRSEP